MKRLLKRRFVVLLPILGALALGGCAIGPTYQYNANNGAGYYSGQSPYGNADTVVRGSMYASPYRGGWWGPGWGYAPGWYGYGGISFGTSIYLH